ncbi:MAG: ATP-binding cassette domain-containing protein [Bacteroidetes bacterium]|nr:ATP-binding cassette domain-containing protein [Bacteroidota bacterium]MBS1649476.1 ATP-binding cassette domain-containing protein [Bacteroidota bacterium]
MQLVLKNIIPIPLKEKLIQRSSDVWNQSLTFNPKEWIKINAPSGTGKTTFIHILYKLRNDYEGIVRYNDSDIKQIDATKIALYRQQNISIVFQDLKLFPNITAKENIELNRVMQTPFYNEDKINEMAETLGVASVLNQKAGLCSYGEQQRIAIIRALMQPFNWLLMDEPFSHLDKANITKAATLIAEECKKRNAGFILTDLDEDEHFDYSNKFLL